ncbi:hypothetical protein AMATHDRAFT_88859 [Amanita thiersii Skay4041]|uniref:Uncharacterized protein n=1 Tax=Amanita thiersii Skay4041 TaxID=703135 RepID=A0A2A9NAM1_9AGAR|nr:hypothetical protein AMATHDRAFT_88859 [Amanita thiersii Skay4041]
MRMRAGSEALSRTVDCMFSSFPDGWPLHSIPVVAEQPLPSPGKNDPDAEMKDVVPPLDGQQTQMLSLDGSEVDAKNGSEKSHEEADKDDKGREEEEEEEEEEVDKGREEEGEEEDDKGRAEEEEEEEEVNKGKDEDEDDKGREEDNRDHGKVQTRNIPHRPNKRHSTTRVSSYSLRKLANLQTKNPITLIRPPPPQRKKRWFNSFKPNIKQVLQIIDLSTERNSPPFERIQDTVIAASIPCEHMKSYTFYGPDVKATIQYASPLPHKIDRDFLDDVVTAAERLYHESLPRHINSPCASVFCILSNTEFQSYSIQKLQDIFRTRHIIVTDIPFRTCAFDEGAFKGLGNSNRTRIIQDMLIEVKENDHTVRLHKSSLRTLVEHSQIAGGHVLNTFNSPLITVPNPDERLAGEMWAWVQTAGRPLCGDDVEFPFNSTRWWTAATKGAQQCWDINAAGHNRVKVVDQAIPKSPTDIGRKDKFLFASGQANKDIWDSEGILLKPGMRLYMRPNTPYMAVTTEHAICKGTHFLAAPTICESCYALIHGFVTQSAFTNTDYTSQDTWQLYCRLVTYYAHEYLESFLVPDRNYDTPHMPDIRTYDGVLDLFTLLAVIKLGIALYLSSYSETRMPQLEWFRAREAMWLVDCTLHWFNAHFRIKDDNGQSPMVFEEILLQFSMTLVHYMDRASKEGAAYPLKPGCTPRAVLVNVLDVLLRRPNLLQLLPVRSEYLTSDFRWTGPRFRVISVTPPPGWEPLLRSERSDPLLSTKKHRITVEEFLEGNTQLV